MAAAIDPADGLSVWSVKYGERVVRRSDVFNDYAPYGLPDGDLDMDYNFWVIRAGRQDDPASTPATTSRRGTGSARSA